MTADEVIALRKEWAGWSFGPQLPAATLLAERDWLNYVRAMAAMIPAGEAITWPSEIDVNWAWQDGLVVVFAEPVELVHTIISKSERGLTGNEVVTPTEPHLETQTLAGLSIGPSMLVPSQEPDGTPGPELAARHTLWLAIETEDVVTGWWMPDVRMHARVEEGISESSRFLVSVITALGHRLTRIAMPAGQGRGERRRVARELPGLRVLELGSGASVRSAPRDSKIERTHRWTVKGHWKLQPYGPKSRLRKLKWIDMYVQGPEGLPLDVRPTVWRTGHKVPEGRL